MELLKPTNDYVFKKIFGKSGNEDILIDLLESIMNVKIKQIEIQKDATLERTIEDNKLGILDIKATLNNNTIVDLEMQVSNINVKRIGEMNMPDFKNKMVQKAMKELETLSGDEEQRRLAELRDKAIRDENDGRTYEREQGKIEGKLEGKTEIVKNMLKNKLDIELICKVTGFTKQEIEQIKNK